MSKVKQPPSLLAADVLDFLHWPLVILLIMGWTFASDQVWLSFIAGVAILQAAFMACPLLVLTTALRRKHDPEFERQGRSLVALAFRTPGPSRLIGGSIAFGVMLGAGLFTQFAIASI